MEAFILVIPILLVIALVIRMGAGGMDHSRIKEYVESNGGRVINSNWSPLGPGWFGEQSDRIYSVSYVDTAGTEQAAFCKTSMWTGVYFTEDRIVQYAERPETLQESESALQVENRRLREELKRLRRQIGEE